MNARVYKPILSDFEYIIVTRDNVIFITKDGKVYYMRAEEFKALCKWGLEE